MFVLQYTFPFIKSPMFVLNSLYDIIQLHCNLQLDCLPPNCSDSQMKAFYNFESVRLCRMFLLKNFLLFLQQFLAQLAPALNSTSAGIFGDSCLIHCQTLQDLPWATYTVGGQTMRETFEDWYFQNTSANFKEIDCPFPCNPTCPASSSEISNTPARVLDPGMSVPPPPPHCTPY